MDILDALDEVRMLNARNNDITTDQMLNDSGAAKQQSRKRSRPLRRDEEEVKNAFSGGGS